MNNLIPDERRVISSFDLTGVELCTGRLRDQYQWTRDYFLAVPNDDMLLGFRQRVGLPSPGKAMGGWYSGDDREMWYSEGGGAHAFGQWLSAFSRMARANGDAAMRDKALSLLHEWAKTIDPDGFCASVGRSGRAWVGHYTYEKTCCGLVDIGHYLENRDAPRHLEKITQWAMKNLGRTRLPAGVHNYSGETPSGEGEWYTLSENLYRAYELTGDTMYRDFAQVWHYTTMWDGLAEGKDTFVHGHAYSHVNTLSSAAMAYAVTGEQQYLKAITNGYEILCRNHLYATGGFGPRETFFPAGGNLSRTLWDNINWWSYPSNFETPCGCWAAFKLCNYLTQFTGAASYGDWVERLIYNGLGAALPMAGYGKTFYYSDYKLTGGSKVYYPELWPCCSGTFPQAVTEYHDLIYYKDATGLYINLFVPSKVQWEHNGLAIEVNQETGYPESEGVHVKVNPEGACRFALRFRVPGWVSGTVTVRLNDRLADVVAKPGDWAVIDREWRKGDTVDIRLPMALVFVPIEPVVPHRVALMLGPVVLVCSKAGRLEGDRADPASWILPMGQPMAYAVRGDPAQGLFQPFYQMAEGQKYWMYKDVIV
ncbi:MAG: glycoside hydrolase family 127 protein [Chloroflexi bacterium]|nr:glycoside hydrolase family 127 protein [Chloroflexota bacterium]